MRVGERLDDFVGDWNGENQLRMMPDDEFSPSPSTASVALAAGANVVTLAYAWADFDGVAQEGLLVLEDGPLPGQVEAVWADSWHSSPRWLGMIGSASEHRVSLAGTYGEGDDLGAWAIHLHLDDREGLRMTMDNAYPSDGEPYEVVWATWRRA